jgi:hypothetical protein
MALHPGIFEPLGNRGDGCIQGDRDEAKLLLFCHFDRHRRANPERNRDSRIFSCQREIVASNVLSLVRLALRPGGLSREIAHDCESYACSDWGRRKVGGQGTAITAFAAAAVLSVGGYADNIQDTIEATDSPGTLAAASGVSGSAAIRLSATVLRAILPSMSLPNAGGVSCRGAEG